MLSLRDEFRVWVTSSSLKRALASVGWSKKAARQRVKEQNANLRDFYLYNIKLYVSLIKHVPSDRRLTFSI
jgi:hypothetical protein